MKCPSCGTEIETCPICRGEVANGIHSGGFRSAGRCSLPLAAEW